MDRLSSQRTSSIVDLSSFTCDEDEQDSVGFDILERFDSDDLMSLRKYFFSETTEDSELIEISSFKGRPLTKDEFIRSVDEVIGSTSYSIAAAKLFDDICKDNTDSKTDVTEIWWEQILDAIIDKIEVHDSDFSLKLVDESNIHLSVLQHCKREPIVKVVTLDTETSFCYVAISKYGLIGVYDGQLNLLETYKVHIVSQAQESSRTMSTWINDAVVLPDATAILIAASNRTLHFLTATGLVHTPMFLISGLPNSPQCLSYFFGNEDPSLLLFGDDHGNITTMRFHQPSISLFRRTSSDRSNSYFWRELEGQDDWVTISIDHNVHSDRVHQVEYIKDNNTVISSSSDPNATVVIRHLSGRRAPYIFKLSRGVRCFHLDRGLKLLVTGSTDNVVRIWNPVVTNTPVALLYGHKATVVDVRVLKQYNSAISVSSDGVLKIWDIEDHCCLQTISLDIPALSQQGKMVEFGTKTLYPGPSPAKPPLSRQPKTSPKLSLKSSHPASLISNTTPSNKPTLTPSDDTQWTRPQFLVVCCNYVILLPISRLEIIDLKPPPQQELSPMVPSPWLRADEHIRITSPDIIDRTLSPAPLSEPLEVISSRALQFLRQCPTELKYQFKPTSTGPCHGLHTSRAQTRAEESHMKSMVEQCAPHLALKLHRPEVIKFSKQLPVTSRMKHLDLSSPDKLMKAKFSAADLSATPTLDLSNNSCDVNIYPDNQRSSQSRTRRIK